MIKKTQLVLDTATDVYELLKPWQDASFFNFAKHVETNQLLPNAIYILGEMQFSLNIDKIIDLVNKNIIKVIYSNAYEGSEYHCNACRYLKISELVKQKKILLITGGNMPSEYSALPYELTLAAMLDYEENLHAIKEYQQQYTTVRPYKFLFLNGRARPHRKYLMHNLQDELTHAIWTNLDPEGGQIRILDPRHEFCHVSESVKNNKNYLNAQYFFSKNQFGERYLKSNAYNETYFSLVGETVFNFEYSFRSEKIWKPVAIGHPWIAAASAGFYRDIHNMGFQSFGHLIDESFDQIDNNQDRLARIVTVVKDLCQQDLVSFLEACYNTCMYNQQHLADMRMTVRQEFPDRFSKFIDYFI